MKKKLYITLVLILLLTSFSGCTDQKSNNGSVVNNQFSINAFGGTFSSTNNKIILEVPENSLNAETIITVKSSSTLPTDTDYTAFCCYDFGPDGTQFNKPITLQITYDLSDIPSGANEEDIMLFTIENDEFVEVEEYVVDKNNHNVQAEITHFCKYFLTIHTVGVSSDNPDDSSDDPGDGSDIEEGTILWTGETELYLTERTSYSPEGHHNPYEDYYYYSYFLWDPHPYTRYYELIYYFNENPPDPYGWQCKWREQGNDWCTPSDYPYKEKIIYEFCDIDIPVHQRPYKDCPVFLEVNGKCAIALIAVKDTFYESEGLSEETKNDYKNQMKSYVQSQIEGWTGTIKAIS